MYNSFSSVECTHSALRGSGLLGSELIINYSILKDGSELIQNSRFRAHYRFRSNSKLQVYSSSKTVSSELIQDYCTVYSTVGPSILIYSSMSTGSEII